MERQQVPVSSGEESDDTQDENEALGNTAVNAQIQNVAENNTAVYPQDPNANARNLNIQDGNVTINQGDVAYINNVHQDQPVNEAHRQRRVWFDGITVRYRALTLRIGIIPATVLSVGAVHLSGRILGLVGQILKLIASFSQVIFRISPGSLLVHVLTEDDAAKRSLLEDLTSNRLLVVVRDIMKEESVHVKAINLVNVGAVITSQKEFGILKKKAKKRIEHIEKQCTPILQILDSSETETMSLLNEDVNADSPYKAYHFSLMQNKARILSLAIPPEDEKQYIETLKRNLEFSIPTSVEENEEEKTSPTKEGFLAKHPQFVEFVRTAQLHPSLQLEVYSRLNIIKHSVWSNSAKSSVIEVEDLIVLPTRHFTGDCEKVLRDVVKIGTALFLRSQSDLAFRLYHWVLDLFHNIGDTVSKAEFLETYHMAIDKSVYLTNGSLKAVLFHHLFMCEIQRRVLDLKQEVGLRFFSLVWLDAHLQVPLHSFLDQEEGRKIGFFSQSLLSKLSVIQDSLSRKRWQKLAIRQCRRLLALPMSTTAVTRPFVEKTLAIAKLLKSKSKFVLCLKFIRLCIELIDRLVLPFHEKQKIHNSDYKLEKLDVCMDTICEIGNILVDYNLNKVLESCVFPLLLDVSERSSFLFIRDRKKKEDARVSALLSCAQFYCHIGQYKRAENTLLSLAKSMLNNREVSSLLSFASCFYLFAVTKQSLGDYRNALQFCKVAILFFKLSDESSDKERQKVFDAAEKLLFDQSNKEDRERLIEVAEHLLTGKLCEEESQKKVGSVKGFSDQATEPEHQPLIEAAQTLEYHLLSLVTTSELQYRVMAE